MAQVITLHRSPRPAVPALERAAARTLQPVDVLLLLPMIVPLATATLLLLLAWFVAWLTIVALLTGTIVTTDLVRRALRRMRAPAIAPLDREAVSFQGR